MRRILIIEDNIAVRDELKVMLRIIKGVYLHQEIKLFERSEFYLIS